MRLKTLCAGITCFAVAAASAPTLDTHLDPEIRIIDTFSIEKAIQGAVPVSWHATQRDVAMFSVREDSDEPGNFVLSIDTKNGNTTIGKKFNYRLRDFPFLSWRWRARTLPTNGREDMRRRADSGCGVYVIFRGRMRLNRMIKYVWSTSLPVGTLTESPYNSRVRIVVLESGDKRLRSWKKEKVNVLKDYARIFGDGDPPEVEGIAIMSDADNTNSAAEADYDDLLVSRNQ